MTLHEIQRTMIQRQIPALIITRNNMFLGEDVLPSENKILELTGFSGSAGMLFVEYDKCSLFVDGRYEIQARQQTNPNQVTVVDCSGDPLEKIAQICKTKLYSTIAANPWCLSINAVNRLTQIHKLIFVPVEDLPKGILADKPINCFIDKYAGKSNREKCREVALQNTLAGSATLICAADQVSWLANIRSDTLPDTPIVRAYAVLDESSKLRLFADHCKDKAVLPLSKLRDFLIRYEGKQVLADFDDTPQKILEILPPDVTLKPLQHNFVASMKMAKNNVEIKGFERAHLRDGVAVTKFLCWLDKHWQSLTELDVVKKLHAYRARQDLFFSESFGTIAATGAHAAIIHYQPTLESNARLEPDSVLLLDSGGQYYDGTTDVTRTIALGNPPDEIKEHFTLVLKAHIALASAIFPDKTPGNMLDALARSILWREGLNYNHGTGHGVGHFSNVHEGPFAISPKNQCKIGCGYVVSNEPGYYKEGHYGIRIENMVVTKPHKFTNYLEFADLTLIPIDKRLIKAYLLSDGEQAWLNNYHQKVWDCLAPLMSKEEKTWLESACSPL